MYYPINDKKKEIRLFRLLEPTATGPIRGVLEHYDLSDCPPFLCLSYTWGPELPVYAISVNDHVLEVRDNLLRFLWHFAHLAPGALCWHFPRYGDAQHPWEVFLWVDQICIDQASVGERNHQVQLMSSIYHQAIEVIAWLGDSAASTLAVQRLPLAHVEYDKSVKEDLRDGLVTAGLWRRIWVHQEILLAKHVTVMGGGATASWAEVLAWKDILLKGDGFRSLYAGQFRNILALRAKDEPVPSLPLIQVIEMFGAGDCADPKDRVYGLLGLVHEDQRIAVDYNFDVKEIAVLVYNKIVSLHAGGDRDALDLRVLDLLAKTFGYDFLA